MASRSANHPLHVCFLCGEYPLAPLVGGIGIFVQTLARALVAAGHRATVVGLYDRQSEEVVEEWDQGVRLIRLSAAARYWKLGWFFNRRRMLEEVGRLIRSDAVDLVEAPDYEGLLWMAPTWPVPRVVRIHGGEVYFRRLLGERLRWKHRIAETASIRRADALASVTRFAWKRSQELFRLSDSSAEILPNPVDTTYFRPGDRTREVPGRIVYTGTFIRKKGVLELFRALPTIFAAVPEAHLVCAGADSPDVRSGSPSTWEVALADLPAVFHERVRFLGPISHDSIRAQLDAAQVCVYPSLLETQGIAWIEAMACQKAIVASNTGTGPEVIEDGRSGLLCHPADQDQLASLVISLLRDPHRAAELAANARQRVVEQFSLERLFPRNVAWYRRVVAEFAQRSGSGRQ